jgi:hypothetical protein
VQASRRANMTTRADMKSIMWRRIDGSGLERSEVVEAPDAIRMSDTTLLATDVGPIEIGYLIALTG